eukprot:scaffold54100_cov65-Phaeocystis_antarctica.AAC.7
MIRLRHIRLDRLGAGGRRGALPVQAVRALQPRRVLRGVARCARWRRPSCAACRAEGKWHMHSARVREFSTTSPLHAPATSSIGDRTIRRALF